MLVSNSVYDVVASLQAAENQDQVAAIMRRVTSDAGYKHFMIAGISRPKVKATRVILAEDWPPEWYARYFDRYYSHHDPVLRHCHSTVEAFAWEEAPLDPELKHYALKVMNEATEFGLRSGFCVPLRAVNGSPGVVSMGGDVVELRPEDRVGLHMIALYAFSRLRSFLPEEAWAGPGLSIREKDALSWSARGKTGAEIAGLMGISEKTVEFYFSSILTKLGTTSRIHSVAEALRYGLIEL